MPGSDDAAAYEELAKDVREGADVRDRAGAFPNLQDSPLGTRTSSLRERRIRHGCPEVPPLKWSIPRYGFSREAQDGERPPLSDPG